MALTVESLSFSYGSSMVLDDISFSAPEGKLTVLLGRNGCGKSTLMKIIAGILPMQQGTTMVAGKDLSGLSGSARAGLIGYLPQFHQTVFPFTVEDVVLTGRAAYVFATPSGHDREKARQAMALVGIEHLSHRPYTELSGGERQLVMVARVLAQTPKVILLDEPASHLDMANQHCLLALLRRITSSGVTVLAVLHDPTTAFLNADEVLFVKQGKIVVPADGSMPWDAGFLSGIYGVETTVIPYGNKAIVIPANDRDGENHHAA